MLRLKIKYPEKKSSYALKDIFFREYSWGGSMD